MDPPVVPDDPEVPEPPVPDPDVPEPEVPEPEPEVPEPEVPEPVPVPEVPEPWVPGLPGVVDPGLLWPLPVPGRESWVPLPDGLPDPGLVPGLVLLLSLQPMRAKAITAAMSDAIRMRCSPARRPRKG